MKVTITFLTTVLFMFFAVQMHADNIWTLDFETSGGYTTEDSDGNTGVEFSDGSYDFFTSTLENTIGSGYGVTGFGGSYYFAAQDMDGEGMNIPAYLYKNGIDISGYSNLQFEIKLAEDDYGDPAWDADGDYLHIEYRIDGGGWQNLLWVESEVASGYNAEPRIDTDFDGVGDGTEIIETFQLFTENIAETGSTIDIRLTFNLNSGGEDIAIDDLKITGTPAGAVANPGNFTATTISTSQIDLSWTLNAAGDDVMVAYNTEDQFGTPSGSYSVGQTISGGGEVIYIGNGTGYSHASLNENTEYFYKAWSVDESDEYSSGVKDSARTYMTVPELYINEFLADNAATNTDENDEYDDWVEIYNPSSSAVDIGGMYLTDDLNNKTKYKIDETKPDSTTIPAGGFLIIWLDGQDNQGVLHANFALSKDGEDIALFGSDGYTPVDSYTFGIQATDVSEGRETDGGVSWIKFNIPTPMESNTAPALKVTSPNGGENWMQGTSQNITWLSQNFTADVKIEVYHNAGYTTLIASTENDGSWTWDIPSDQETGGDYKIRISDAVDSDPFDESDDNFSIIEYSEEPQHGDLVINEILQNPAYVSDTDGEWFELYNATDSDIDIDGWTLRDNDSDSHVVDNGGPLLVPAGGYLVLGRNADQGTNGGVTVDYEYSGITLGNSDDELYLITPTGTIVDSVLYDGGPEFPNPNGYSMELNNPANDNNVGGNWNEATTLFNESDYGTPGSENSTFVSIVEENYDLPITKTFKLFSNYPNPFNPSTTIRFAVPHYTGELELIIYDILGNKIKTLHDGSISSGTHELKWNASNENGNAVPSGIYFAQLISGEFHQTIRMLLIK